jgi:leucine dehydrogenase
MSAVFSSPAYADHEEVVFLSDKSVGLRAIIAIHNTACGPALGGCRMRNYSSEAEAIEDVLRLSEGMTFKNALAGLNLGGGKSIIFGDPHTIIGDTRIKLFEAFASALEKLVGRYITAEDMGTTVEDAMIMRRKTKYVTGLSSTVGGSGDPSVWTSKGVFLSIKAACERVFDKAGVAKRVVAVQGLGHVGMHLVRHLVEANAEVYVTDPRKELLDFAAKCFGVHVVPEVDAIYDVPAEIFAPCAIGQTVREENIKRLTKCVIIAGAANNQLSGPEMYHVLEERKILYCPDFVVNAGGVINVAAELEPKGYNQEFVSHKVEQIYHTIHKILDESERQKLFPEVIAKNLAMERVCHLRK